MFLEFLMTNVLQLKNYENFIYFWTLPLIKRKQKPINKKNKSRKAEVCYMKDQVSTSIFIKVEENKWQQEKGTTQDTYISIWL